MKNKTEKQIEDQEATNAKALDIMRESVPINKKAEDYFKTIKRNLQKQVLDVLIDKKEHLEDTLASYLDFSLDVNINKGINPITREEAEKRFGKALEIEYELTLVTIELKTKQDIYDKYFSNGQA